MAAVGGFVNRPGVAAAFTAARSSVHDNQMATAVPRIAAEMEKPQTKRNDTE
jgi:hypothetical protein